MAKPETKPEKLKEEAEMKKKYEFLLLLETVETVHDLGLASGDTSLAPDAAEKEKK